MRTVVLTALFVVALLAALSLGQDDDPPTITWRTDLAEARVDAAEKGRPLMVVFR